MKEVPLFFLGLPQTPFLQRDFSVYKLGATALEGILGKSLQITKHRGQVFDYPYNRKIKVLLTYHPAYILRNPVAEKEFVEDLKK